MITFDDKVTDAFVRQQVVERLQTADLPTGVQPQIAPLSTAIGEIYRYRLRGDGVDSRDLRTLEDWVVERNLAHGARSCRHRGNGRSDKDFRGESRPGPVAGLWAEPATTLYCAKPRQCERRRQQSEQGPQQYLIRGLGLLRSPEDIGNVVLASRGGVPVTSATWPASESAMSRAKELSVRTTATMVVTGIVLMRKGENPSEVLKGVKAKIELLNHSILPRGVQIVSFYDRTWLINTTLHTVFKNLAEGAMLVAFVLLLFLGNLRAALIVAIMIPLSLLATFIG